MIRLSWSTPTTSILSILVGPWNLSQRFLMHGSLPSTWHGRLEQMRTLRPHALPPVPRRGQLPASPASIPPAAGRHTEVNYPHPLTGTPTNLVRTRQSELEPSLFFIDLCLSIRARVEATATDRVSRAISSLVRLFARRPHTAQRTVTMSHEWSCGCPVPACTGNAGRDVALISYRPASHGRRAGVAACPLVHF